ncbi:MAG TPA: L,D-transpeptidase [Chthoniobacteraceae bacterium]|nr:L,D-transpeptidase [Chthoniobacteraceae bacterium]
MAICLSGLLLASCAHHDTHHTLVISVPDQKMVVYTDSRPVAEYPVSTSKYGVGDHPGSRETPLGLLEVEKKFGDNVPSGGVLKSRRFTGEILLPNAPGRDPIVTRILWLRGLEEGNRHAFNRCIYIHGTPVEEDIGRPASYGCIRMRSEDVIHLYNTIGVGTKVEIVNSPLAPAPGEQVAQLETGG